MRRIAALAALAALLLATTPAIAAGCPGAAAVCPHPASGALALIGAAGHARIVTDPADDPAVLRAARTLDQDIARVARSEETAATRAVIIGTIGHNAIIDRLITTHRLDTRAIAGRWEGFVQQVVDRPAPGIARALVIAGRDRRGAIYGSYDLSARIGVSPWTWWADVPVPHRARLWITPGAHADCPRVRYRGIFLNDEDPALKGWADATYGGFNHQFYGRLFELILRLKGNLLWPAMWSKAFYDDDPANKATAQSYGVIIGTSHHEPLMRAHVEWARYGKGPWDYTTNATELQAFWRKGMERAEGGDTITTIGMRGDGDKPMTEGTAIPLLERIVGDQRRIIAEVTGKPASETPQVWALYKEVQDYYDQGMRVPDDVTLLFSDDNWGNLRRLPKPGDARAGGFGIYYHFDYVGGPAQLQVDQYQPDRAHLGADEPGPRRRCRPALDGQCRRSQAARATDQLLPRSGLEPRGVASGEDARLSAPMGRAAVRAGACRRHRRHPRSHRAPRCAPQVRTALARQLESDRGSRGRTRARRL